MHTQPTPVAATISITLFTDDQDEWASVVQTQGDFSELVLLIQASKAIRSRLMKIRRGSTPHKG